MDASALPTAGYSGKPLADKLGLKDGMAIAFVGLPAELRNLVTARRFARVTEIGSWSEAATLEGPYEVIHAFAGRAQDLATGLRLLQGALRRDGMIWVSWPKKASGVATDVTEDTVRASALALDLVDVKVAAVSAVWSGLKLMIRKDRR